MRSVTLFVPLHPAMPEGGDFGNFQFYKKIFFNEKKISSLRQFAFGFLS